MIRLQKVSLEPLTSFHVPTTAEVYLRLETLSDIEFLAKSVEHLSEPYLILGGGSNVLFVDDYPGTILHVSLKGISIVEDKDSVLLVVGAGMMWDQVVAYCVQHGFYGLENLSLIPGYVGAAPVQNIGAYGSELSSYFEFLEAINLKNGLTERFDRHQCSFGYRDSIFKNPENKHLLITRVGLRLSKDPIVRVSYHALEAELDRKGIKNPSPADIRDTVIAIRRQKLPDPDLLGNAGSFFKNPLVSEKEHNHLLQRFPDLVSYPDQQGNYKIAAGWLIDKQGWKAYRKGDAGVHDKQALVLVNHGKATGREILQLARQIRKDIWQAFGILLDTEVNIIGETLSE